MRLNQEKVRRMVGRGFGSGSGAGGGVSQSDLEGFATQPWVEQNYISKEFFNTLFTIHGHDADDTGVPPTDVIIEPNDTETVLDSIEAMVGLWTEKYLSALGLSSGGGGGGDVLAEPLVSINGIGSPTAANQTLVWDGTRWSFKPYGQGGGSVTSIRITVPTGFAVSPSTAITTAGTFAISFASGYSLPSTADQANWNTAYNNSHSHSNKTVLDGITSTKVSNWDTAYGNFDANGNAKSALKLTTVSKTAWGRTYWTANGVPDSISGDIENAANIKIDNDKKVSWKKSGASNYLSMLTLDASNNFIVGESMANEGLATYVRGRSINFQTGTGSSGNHAASMSDAGLFTVEKLRIGSIVISEDTQNGGLHVESAGLYADNYISALGANSESGGGVGDVTWSALASSSDTRQIAASHLSSVTQPLYFLFNDDANPTVTYNGKTNQAVGNILTKSYADGRYVKQSGNAIISGTATIGGNMTIGATEAVGTVNSQVIQTLNRRAIYIKTGTASNFVDGTWSSTSDIRLKDIINNVGASVDQIANAPIFNYKWKSGGVSIMLGSSAQYWQNVFQHAVEIGPENYLYMDYSSVALASAVMVARKVVNHEERIRQLERENEKLRKLLNIA